MNKYFSVQSVATKDGTFTIPHPEHGQHYHTLQGAKYESLALYVEQSGFSAKIRGAEKTAVLDVGLGLGYNALTTIETWFGESSPSDLNLCSLEIDQELFLALLTARAPWQVNWPKLWLEWVQSVQKQELFYFCEISHPISCALCTWEIWIGDGLEWVQNQATEKDFKFIWQDPFTPELNPRLWSAEFFAALKKIVSLDVVLLSYSVARVVKDALQQAGWTFQVIRGKKLHKDWLKAWLINS